MIKIGDVLVLHRHDVDMEDFFYLVIGHEWRNSYVNLRTIQLSQDINYMKTIHSSPLSFFELALAKRDRHWSLVSND